tara:strand:- start:854 stop:1585 length:732 start_codon:yes stop_codon:yes gene_type:complete
MPDIYSGTGDGRVASHVANSGATWADSRDATSGTSVVTNESSSADFVSVSRFGSRGGGNTYKVQRTFLVFDVSSITGTVADVILNIYGSSDNDGTIWGVKGLNFIGSLAVGNFDNITGYSPGNTMIGNVTQYTSINTGGGNWSTSGYNGLTGTSDLKTDIQNENSITIVMTDYLYDARNVTPTSNGTFNCGGYYADNTGTSKDPYLSIKIAGYEHDVNTVVAASIGKVNTVAAASIGKINSVD